MVARLTLSLCCSGLCSHGPFTTLFMIQRRLTRTNVPRLGPCLVALRVLAKSKGLHRHVLIERHIDEYLRTDPFSLAHALERLRKAIHFEEFERREGASRRSTFAYCCIE